MASMVRANLPRSKGPAYARVVRNAIVVGLLVCGCESALVSTHDASADGARADAPTDAFIEDASDVPADAALRCTLTPSGPLTITTAGAIVARLDITSDGESGLVIQADGVIVRDVRIRYAGGHGIELDGAADVTIENVDVEHTGAPASGANDSDERNDIDVYASPRLTVRGARLVRGSSGIYLQDSPGSMLTDIEGHDFRGPLPRGQLVQWNRSGDAVLDGFSCVNPAGSWPEDVVNVYDSTNVTIRNGLVDGDNSPSGVGVIFDANGSGVVEDVDAVHMGNGCFSAYAGLDGSVFRRTRCRDNDCSDQGRGAPLSGALMWSGNPDPSITHLRIESSSYANACNPGNIVWPAEAFEVAELTEADFAPRAPLSLSFCWD
jgi:hypothetical protein